MMHIFLLEDEPLISMDLQFAAEDRGCALTSAATNRSAAQLLEKLSDEIEVAILDVSLSEGETCLETARLLEELGIPYLLHSGDLNRVDERIRDLEADLIAKPAPADAVISAAISLASRSKMPDADRLAAE